MEILDGSNEVIYDEVILKYGKISIYEISLVLGSSLASSEQVQDWVNDERKKIKDRSLYQSVSWQGLVMAVDEHYIRQLALEVPPLGSYINFIQSSYSEKWFDRKMSHLKTKFPTLVAKLQAKRVVVGTRYLDFEKRIKALDLLLETPLDLTSLQSSLESVAIFGQIERLFESIEFDLSQIGITNLQRI